MKGQESIMRRDVQGLRAIAVLAVIFYHAKVFGFQGGYVGVDVFFVISGYLITGVLCREYFSFGKINLLRFYYRRAKRLLPTMMVVFSSTVILSLFILSPIEQKELIKPFFFTAIYSSNIWFASDAMDYLAVNAHLNPVLHTWSLAVEEQFYLFWPLVIVFISRISVNVAFKKMMLCASLIVFLCSLLLCLVVVDISEPWAFFGTPMRAWEFGVGALGYLIKDKSYAISSFAKSIVFYMGIFLIVLSVNLFSDKTVFPGYSTLLPVIGALFVLASDGKGNKLRRAILENSLFVYIGNISYSLYLWHWPIQVLLFPGLPEMDFSKKIIFMLITFILSAATFSLVENKYRCNSECKVSSREMLAFPIVIALFSVALVFVYRGVNHNSLNNTEQKRIVNSLSDNPKIYSDKCHLSLLDTEIPPCIYGDILGAKTVVLFGDSHAAHWFPALDSLAKKYGWRLISLTKSACPSFDVSVVNSALGRKYMECDIWRESAFLRIKNADPYLVVLANSSKYLLDTTKADFEFGMTRTLKKIANKKYNVIISDTPWPNDNPLTCLSKAIWLEREISQCNFVEKSLHRKDMKLLDMRVSSKYEQTFNIDLYDEFCSSSVCFVEKAGDVVYRDSHHMTAKFSTNLNSSLYLKLKSYMDNL